MPRCKFYWPIHANLSWQLLLLRRAKIAAFAEMPSYGSPENPIEKPKESGERDDLSIQLFMFNEGVPAGTENERQNAAP